MRGFLGQASKLEITSKSTRPQAEWFYCFRAFGNVVKPLLACLSYMYYFIFIQWHIVTEHVILSKHVALQCRWQSIDLDLLKLVKEERGNFCGLHYCEVYQPI